MASNYTDKKNNYKTSVMKPQPNVGSSRQQEGEQNHEGSGRNVWWSDEYNCYVINGVLAPEPISCVPLETGAEDESQSASPQGEPSRRKRAKEGNDELAFKLFKFPSDNEYLLEMQEVETGNIERYRVQVYESSDKWKVGVHELKQGDHTVYPMLEDPIPLVFQKKYELSLQERLIGWTVEKRKRSTGKEDKAKAVQVLCRGDSLYPLLLQSQRPETYKYYQYFPGCSCEGGRTVEAVEMMPISSSGKEA